MAKKQSATKPPQFLGKDGSKLTPHAGAFANRAIYIVSPLQDGDEPLRIMVECAEGSGYTPRDAAFWEIKLDLEKEMQTVARMAEVALQSLKKLEPGDVEIEFGVELGGQAGFPLVTKLMSNANFKITLKWSNDKKSS